jgi:adenylyltransferase/sulfurtransferase
MPVTIVIPTPLRQFAGGNSEFEVQASTAGDALQELAATHGELRKHLYNEQNNLRNFINVYVGDEDIRHLDGPNTPVKDGETIMIVPSIAGGSGTRKLARRARCPSFLTKRSYAIRDTSSCRKSAWKGSGN